MTTVTARSEPQEETSSDSPGTRLQKARKSANLSIQDVSERLRLDPQQIEALERDDYGKMHASTFVRGYLRAYAKLLELSPDPILDLYDRKGFAPPELVPDIAGRPQAKSSDTSVRLTTYLIVAVLIVLTAIWWQTQKGTDTSMQPEQSAVAREETVPATEPTDEEWDKPLPEEAAVAEVYVEPAPEPVVEAPREPVMEPVTEWTEEPEPSVADSPAAEDTATEENRPTEAAEEIPSAEEVLTEEPPPTESASVQTTAVGRLDIDFNHDSWVEVYDAMEERLFFNLVKDGDRISLEGQPPFRVLIGYASSARIEYNGQFFDHMPYADKGVARFTIDGTE